MLVDDSNVLITTSQAVFVVLGGWCSVLIVGLRYLLHMGAV
uniref:Uncharacterized protein n=1 Tax=Anguilla anguilla TaxID=7936 RepID=A0A0E9WBX3_ANGAN